ncbi:LysE family transporter [Micromonospora siamensis]|uniref:Arginine exporter protein ArgO n=1 Tax=Micromonospora siamensis TaxID=299152 RepID=A0A1C5JD03_9ACTN|nr:LysE family transporter [Micromonospora siamensis]SCG68413.1 Arginine exporter protein ArgO [Micromonospora siamensis]
MLTAFVAGLLAGYGVAIPVGAIAVLILGLAARTSFRVGAAAALAVATADGLYAAVAVVGGAGLAALVTPVAGPLRVAAAVVLLGLAAHGLWRAWRGRRGTGRADHDPGRADHDPGRADRHADHGHQGGTRPPGRAAGDGLGTPRRAYLGLLALTLLNPTTVVYFAALVLSRRDAASLDPAAGALFVVGAFVASASWQLTIAGGGTLVGRALAGPRGRLVTAAVSSALIAALAVAVLLP